jgi:hypothetical protein
MYRYVGTLVFAFSAVALGSAGDISKVNGSINVAAGQQAGDVSTVNGSITVGSGGQVRDVETVNGDFVLEGATVGGGIETVSGDVLVGAGSRVENGIHVEKNRGWSWNKSDRPRITIESGAVVNGTLEFEREVDLYVGAGAQIGPIEGVAPQRHSLP